LALVPRPLQSPPHAVSGSLSHHLSYPPSELPTAR
jgi:hypothetical protein